MVFNSWVFVVFAVVVYLLYLRLGHIGQNRLLLVASCVFYGYFDYRFLALVFVSAGLDYLCSHGMALTNCPRNRLWLLVLAIAGNLIILGFFKYYDFFVVNVQILCRRLGWVCSLHALHLLLPAGISFYTFQSMSYTIDVYRGKTQPCRSARDFGVAVMFFPHLVAGPIQRAGNLIDQVVRRRVLTVEYIRSGLWLMLKGYFMKVVVADNVAAIADRAFAMQQPHGTTALLGIYAFTLQIYCDFAGYSSIALGLAKMMGFDLMVNFRQPYLAIDPSDFWQRWHISLSTWLRDYLYIPLGGNRVGRLRTHLNLVITMLLGGLWHGAAWKYIGWGLYHGILLVMFRLFQRPSKQPNSALPWLRPLRMLLFFHITCVGWLIFRCENTSQIRGFLRAIITDFTWGLEQTQTLCLLVALAAPVVILDLLAEYGMVLGQALQDHLQAFRAAFTGVKYTFGSAAVVAMLFLLWLVGSRGGHPFIYFQF